MPTLPELEAAFSAAILREDARGIEDAILADGLAPAARLQIYRNHVLASLTEALEATFPVVCRLVDRRFFGFAADRYIRSHPPAGPCLFEYGETFADFLSAFPPCAGHPYLADVARLEWAMNTALHAEDVPAMIPDTLTAVPAADVRRLVFQLEPSVAWLQSPWPIDHIWRANQPEADPRAEVDLTAGVTALEVRRRGEAVAFRRLHPATFAFRAAVGRRQTLETATRAALAEDAAFDLAPAFRALLDEALLAGFTLAPDMSREGDSR